MAFVVYILECSDKALYTGLTWNLEKRLNEHRIGQVSFTSNRLPVRLIYTEKFFTRVEAARREKEIKGWNRKKKLSLTQSLR